MTAPQTRNSPKEGSQAGPPTATAPALSLPKGGGAIRGIGEKFAANPVTGTGSLTVPIATSPGRSGFGPELSLTYDSGAGNGPFGFGWALSLPAISRKTDKGLPQYRDAGESDIFVLSGAEDLVPDAQYEQDTSVDGFAIDRYRPRVEGAFARIERWTRLKDGDVHWRAYSRENNLTLYGADGNSRIFDPGDPLRIFSWLICQTRDDRGNAIHYEYKPEDGAGVDLTRAHERNRGDRSDPRRTANRYVKRIRYGNRVPLLDADGHRPHFLTGVQVEQAGWMFEAVFDYGEHDATAPKPGDAGPWALRGDAFSSYRSGFEVRTSRLCRRVLMFHHFESEAGVGADCLVRSTDFAHAQDQVYTFLSAVTQTGYRREGSGYIARHMPPVEFEYSRPVVQDRVEAVDAGSLANLPGGADGSDYRWVDLHGEGIPGILTEQASGWFYKRNLSPAGAGAAGAGAAVLFGPAERVDLKPNLSLAGGTAQFMDLAGDGLPDLVVLDGPGAGLYEHDAAEGWQPLRPLAAHLTRSTRDPNVRLVDLNGDGHADLLITEQDALIWHPSLAEAGFGPARAVAQALDEESGPHLLFADGSESIYLADMSGDGLTDLVRIRNGEVCYWPNLGYGRFGPKVAMDQAPWFDAPEQFDQKRLRLADIDGSGTTDIIYLHGEGVRLYFNQSGNGWSAAQSLSAFPPVDNLASIETADLLGNGTACLVWSSSLPGDAGQPMRYVNLMGAQKPHLLVRMANNLGAETRIQYAPSTRFYLADRLAGKPWLTRLPFPVQVVERVELYDRVSRNRFTTRYAYHHGYFDGEEREFRGFGMVEQWDTAEFTALSSDLPPVLTRTWFQTGAWPGSAGMADEYYREPGLTGEEALSRLLPDTVLPETVSPGEEREACRALKGSLLRQEVYALDGTPAEIHPYTVTEKNYTAELLQHRSGNGPAVFFVHPREAITCQYERQPADPRVAHTLTLDVDDYGNVRKEVTVSYGRLTSIRVQDETGAWRETPNPGLSELTAPDRERQTRPLVTYTESRFTNPVDDLGGYRTPLAAETCTYELTGCVPGAAGRFTFDEWTGDGALPALATAIPYEQAPDHTARQKRLIEAVRTLYRPDDCGEAEGDALALLPLQSVQPRALPGESYKLAFTPGLLEQVYQRAGELLLDDPAAVLGGQAAGQGGYVDLDGDGHWWVSTGRTFFSPGSDATPAQERAHACRHFFLQRRYRDPFGSVTAVAYDGHDLLVAETCDAIGNRVTAGERLADGTLAPGRPGNDYRVLQPCLVTDPNRNRSAVAFDAFGLVVGTAVMGKAEENLGDSLEGFAADIDEAAVLGYLADPLAGPHALLGRATTRLVYDRFAYRRTMATDDPQPTAVCTLSRETHDADLDSGVPTRIQQAFAYSDGYGREIQRKIQAEAAETGAQGERAPRWVGSGWTVFNNKARPVRTYEPFFTATHRFEFNVRAGVSPVLFYDPLERVVATLNPDHTWAKTRFDPWRQETWDAGDTVLIADPALDPDAGPFFGGLAAEEYLPTWHDRNRESRAAAQAAGYAATPTVTYLDNQGRSFLTVTHNRFSREGAVVEEKYSARIELDIEGNQRTIHDADRIIMRYDYDLLGNRIHQSGMESGERWLLSDVTGKAIRLWDSRGHATRTEYDPLRRPQRILVTGADPARPNQTVLTEHLVYGEQHPEAERRNLRGRLCLHLDQAGVETTSAHDFKGNALGGTRRLAREYRQAIDWSSLDALLPADATKPFDPAALEAALLPLLEADTYSSQTTFDALNRAVTLHTPDGSVIRPGYNEANLLERVAVNRRGAVDSGGPVFTPFVTNIDYNARGQRIRIEYGNGADSTYEYDPLTARLLHVLTQGSATAYQDLYYTYDPVGNITAIRDEAQQSIYFRNRRVEPGTVYTYDATYRLIEATGREHLGQGGAPALHPGDGNAVSTYTERYLYDAVGNLLHMQHRGSDPAHAGWERTYTYGEDSLTEPTRRSNRLSQTTVGDGVLTTESYRYDEHGNMVRMPHLGGAEPEPNLHWDYRDQLCRADLGGGGTAWYVYDAAGRRVRKVWAKSASLTEERVYLGGYELYRRRQGTERLERETLHVMDGKQRIALIETRTVDTAGDDAAPAVLTRYQFGNHLGSAALELDEAARIISYEEYTPYGVTSYQAVRSATETPKRYRFTGKERDEESGLYYHGVRYYAPWLGRWTACDPTGTGDGANLYRYAGDNPLRLIDPDGRRAATAQEQQVLNRLDDLANEADRQFNKQSGAGQAWDYFASDTGPTRQGAHVRANSAKLKAAIARAGENDRIHVIAEYGTIQIKGDNDVVLGEVPRFAEYLTDSEVRIRQQLQVLSALQGSPISAGAYIVADAVGASQETKEKLALAGAPLWDMVAASAGMAQGLKQKIQQRPLQKAMDLQSSLEKQLLTGDNAVYNRQTTISVGVRYEAKGSPTIEVSVNKSAAKPVVQQLQTMASQGQFTFVQGPGHAEPNLWNRPGYERMDIFASNYNCSGCASTAPPNVTLHDQKFYPGFRATGNPNMSVAPDSTPFPYQTPVRDPLQEVLGYGNQ